MRASSRSVGTSQSTYSSSVLDVTVSSPTVAQLATQFRISSCHQASQGVVRSSSVEILAARFKGVGRLAQSGGRVTKNASSDL